MIQNFFEIVQHAIDREITSNQGAFLYQASAFPMSRSGQCDGRDATRSMPPGLRRAPKCHFRGRAAAKIRPNRTNYIRCPGKHDRQNLWPLNSRWLWFVQYFAKCRGRGFDQFCPGCQRLKAAESAGIRVLPMRRCVWVPSRNLSRSRGSFDELTIVLNLMR